METPRTCEITAILTHHRRCKWFVITRVGDSICNDATCWHVTYSRLVFIKSSSLPSCAFGVIYSQKGHCCSKQFHFKYFPQKVFKTLKTLMKPMYNHCFCLVASHQRQHTHVGRNWPTFQQCQRLLLPLPRTPSITGRASLLVDFSSQRLLLCRSC